MSCLTIVRTACMRLGLPAPAAVVTSTDMQVLQMLALLNEEGQTLSERTNWQELTFEGTFTTVADENQYQVGMLFFPIRFVINDTIWNRSLRRPVYGPLSPQAWQQKKAMFMQGPFNQYRIREGYIKFIPIPAAGQDCYFEYVTNSWVTDADQSTYAGDVFSADSDVSRLDENLLTMGLIWRWRQVKGLDFSADYEKYEKRVLDAIGRDASKPVLNMAGGMDNMEPVVLVPRGSWGV